MADLAERVQKAQKVYVRYYKEVYKNVIKDYNFKLEQLVLLQNTKVKIDLGQKTKPRYLRLYVVCRRTEGRLYMIVELDETVAKY